MITIETVLAEDAWNTLVRLIMDTGEEIEDERDLITKELLNVIVTIQDPENSNPPEGYFAEAEKLKKYHKQFLDPRNQGFPYTYGNRLREHFGFKLGRDVYRVRTDQVESVINRLEKSETTRRATMAPFDPSIDQYQDEIPALIMVDFKIRKNRLYTTAIWRSHDIFRAWIPNFFSLRGLAKYIADHVHVALGPVTMHSVSAHIYKTNFKDTSKFNLK